MQEDGFVSLWLCVAPTTDSLEEYVVLTYNDDGELVPSQFMQDFELARWDESYREAECLDARSNSVAEVLSGFSYDEEIIKQFEQNIGQSLAFPVNAVVLLYNFNHRNPKSTKSEGEIQLSFFGVARYSA